MTLSGIIIFDYDSSSAIWFLIPGKGEKGLSAMLASARMECTIWRARFSYSILVRSPVSSPCLSGQDLAPSRCPVSFPVIC
jgi:hypothetical protein